MIVTHFETFRKALVPLGRQPNVTIQRRGTITLNAAAFAALNEPEAVELLFDGDDSVLGLRAVPADVEHAAFVRPSNPNGHGNGPYVISAMAFLRHYQIDTSEARRWHARLQRDILCIDLTGSCEHVSKTRSQGSPSPPRRPRPHK